MSSDLLICLVALATSAAVCNLIVRSVKWHLPFTGDHPGVSVQKFHSTAVPRVGGVGLLAGMVVSGFLLSLQPSDIQHYWLLILSLLPAFLGGFAEDITRKVGPGSRLLLTVITAAFAFSLAGVRFVDSHMQWLNYLLAFMPFGYLALLLAVAGVAHAMNLIDGYNGLASGVAVIILGALGFVAQMHGDGLVMTFCYVTAAATVGFLLLNYPSGRLFLGDGGAYLLGCTIALASALLILRNREVSPWFPFALVIYPVWETLFSILRRAFLYRTKIGQPDAKHLHSLVYRRVSRRWARGRRQGDKAWRNSLTTLPFWLANGVLAFFAVTWSDNTRIQQMLAVLFIVGYCVTYWRLGRLAVPVAGIGERLKARAGARRPLAETGPSTGK